MLDPGNSFMCGMISTAVCLVIAGLTLVCIAIADKAGAPADDIADAYSVMEIVFLSILVGGTLFSAIASGIIACCCPHWDEPLFY